MTFTEAQFTAFSEKERANRILEGTAYWAFVQKPKHSEKYNSDTFQISLNLDAAGVAKAESFGLEVQPADKYNPMPHVIIQRKVKPGKTFEECQPDVVDSMQKPAHDLIGNDSKVIVKFATYYFGGKVRTTLFKVQILTLVPFVGKGGGFVMNEAGFKSAASGAEFDN